MEAGCCAHASTFAIRPCKQAKCARILVSMKRISNTGHLKAVPVLLAGVARRQLFDEDICGVLASQLAGDDANLESLHTFQCGCSGMQIEPNTHLTCLEM